MQKLNRVQRQMQKLNRVQRHLLSFGYPSNIVKAYKTGSQYYREEVKDYGKVKKYKVTASYIEYLNSKVVKAKNKEEATHKFLEAWNNGEVGVGDSETKFTEIKLMKE